MDYCEARTDARMIVSAHRAVKFPNSVRPLQNRAALPEPRRIVAVFLDTFIGDTLNFRPCQHGLVKSIGRFVCYGYHWASPYSVRRCNGIPQPVSRALWKSLSMIYSLAAYKPC